MPAIVHLITGLEIGGAERMLVQLAARTDRDRFPTTVVSMTDAGKLGRTLTAAGITVETLGMRRGVAGPSGLARLGKILRRERPLVLQTWLYHADLLGVAAYWLGGVEHLLWNIRCSESIGSKAVRLVLSRLSATPDAVIVNALAGRHFHERLGYRPKHWEHIPNGIDTSNLRPDEAARRRLRAELGIDEAAVAIGLPARYHPMKDHATFLSAAAELAQRRRDAQFVLVGTGIAPQNRELSRAIAAHGLGPRVHLLGERQDMRRVYPALDIASLSSAFGEGWPNVLGEAMACGVPCVATDSGDSAEIIGNTGFVVPPRDPAALAAAWERLAALGPEERRSLGLEARERIVRHFDLDRIVGRYESFYDEIAAARRGEHRPRA
jgi:glycosyltransferase involved in cell wall biosynthesis